MSDGVQGRLTKPYHYPRLDWTPERSAGWKARGEGLARECNPYADRYGTRGARREWFVGWDERQAVVALTPGGVRSSALSATASPAGGREERAER